LIGVISSDKERKVVSQFFELFKTPWGFYDPHRSYDVVLSTQNKIQKTNSKLLIIYSSDKSHFDDIREIRVQSAYRNASVEYHRTEIPIYGNLLTFEGVGRPILYVKDNSVEVVHVHNMPNFLIFAGIIPRIFGRKMILDIHDSAPETFRGKFGKLSKPFYRILCLEESICCALAHKVVCVNDVQREVLIKWGISAKKLFY